MTQRSALPELPLDPNAYNVFVLYAGYVESGALSPIIVSMSKDHEFPLAATWKEAWEISFASFRKVYLAALKQRGLFDEEGRQIPRYCCQEALNAKRKPRFCPDCGTSLTETAAVTFPSEEDVEARTDLSRDFMSEMCASGNDGWGETWQLADRLGWYLPGHLQSGYVTIVHANAESLLVNYEHEKTSHYWDEENGFWSEDTVSIFRMTT